MPRKSLQIPFLTLLYNRHKARLNDRSDRFKPLGMKKGSRKSALFYESL